MKNYDDFFKNNGYVFLNCGLIHNVYEKDNYVYKIVKCGFPSNSLQKYIGLLSSTNYKIKIVDNSNTIAYTVSDYNLNTEIKKLLQTISNIDTETLSIPEAYSLLNDFKDIAQKIILKVV